MNKKIEELKQQLSNLERNHDLLIDTFQQEREDLCKEIKKHSDARKRAVKKIKTIRHEICEKIRNFFDVNPDTVDWDYLNEILNQIEQGNE